MPLGGFGARTETGDDLSVLARAEDIRDVPAFAELSEGERLDVAAALQERRVRKDRFIFHEGAPATALYVVKSGKVKVLKTTPEGKEQILGIFDRGEIIGAAPVFGGGRYPASAFAITFSELYALQRADCLYLAEKHPRLTIGTMRVMTDRLRKAHELARDLAYQTVGQRTASLLLRLAEEHGMRTEGGLRIDLFLSRDELAEMVGTSRETVIRVLSRMAKTGIISLVKRSIIIRDEQGLRTFKE